MGLNPAPAPASYRSLLWFWMPLAGTWLIMAAEGPFLTAVIARLDNPESNLAAFGVAFAFAIIIEAPVIMLMSASTALVDDRQSYLALRRFAYGLSAALTGIQGLLLLPSVFGAVARTLNLPADVAGLAHGALFIMLPWTGAIGYRRFRQGLLIKANLTRRVAYGTVIRLVAMTLTALVAYRVSTLPGASLGAAALSVAVIVEAVASRFMTAPLIPKLLARSQASARRAGLGLGDLARFYTPLALTSVLALASQPIVTFFMGQSRYALESLATLPVIHGLTFIFRAVGLSYLEVVIARLGPHREHLTEVRNFAGALAVAAGAGLAVVAFTPLSFIWYRGVSGLSLELATFAVAPTRVLTLLPALSVVLAFERGLLVHAHRNTPITWSTLVELTSVVAILTIGIHVFDLVGMMAAAVAIVGARLIGNLWLAPSCLDVIRRTPVPSGDAAERHAPERT